MFVLFVYFVSMNLLMIKTEENIVRIDVKDTRCEVITEQVTLVKGSNFTLEVRSDYFIKSGFWNQTLKKDNYHNLHELGDSKWSITYETKTSNKGGGRFSESKRNHNITYKYSHTQKVGSKHSGGKWDFKFEVILDFDPWTFNGEKVVKTWRCNTFVQINPSSAKSRDNSNSNLGSGPDSETSRHLTDFTNSTWLIIVVCVFGILLFVQSTYIIYAKARGGKSKKNNDEDPISPKSPKTKRGSKPRRNIADRPPLPLPPDEEVKEATEPKPSPPISPIPKRHHLFPQASAPPMPVENAYNNHHAGPKQSYINKGLVTSDERVKSPPFARRPMEGPLVTKQSYKNQEFDNTDEDIRRPGFPRKRMEGPLVLPKQPYRNKPFDSSDEELSPGYPRRQMEGPNRNKALENLHAELRSPGFPRRQEGPLVRKQSYINKSSDNSEEELRTPGYARRQIEAKLAQLPAKAVTPSKSFKLPKPLPRSSPSPPPPPEKIPAFHRGHRKEPAPPLHPKKLPVFPPPVASRQPESRLSDVDWQYEKLEPASKYLNKFPDIPYDNMM